MPLDGRPPPAQEQLRRPLVEHTPEAERLAASKIQHHFRHKKVDKKFHDLVSQHHKLQEHQKQEKAELAAEMAKAEKDAQAGCCVLL